MTITNSRYGDKRIVKNVGGGCFTVEGPSRYYRVASDENKVSMYDFEGGPCLFVGESFSADGIEYIIDELIPEKSKENWGKVTVIVKDNQNED